MQPNRWIAPLADEETAVLRDGRRMRVPLMLRDHEVANLTVADEQRARERGLSVSQAQYENRLSEVWKQDAPTHQPQITPKMADNQQAAYEARILNGWKGGA